MLKVPLVIYRGGTSKGIFINQKDLPGDNKKRDLVISRLFGSPDKRQIDGLGGADPLTSKLAILDEPKTPGVHINYTFGQVDIYSNVIEYQSICGNLTAAIGPYAIDEGYVEAIEPFTTVQVYNTNIAKILEVTVPVKDGKVEVEGEFAIDGVPGTGARIDINWANTVGANTGTLLPTGNVIDRFYINRIGDIEASIVDVGNPGIFVRAADLGLKGIEDPKEIDENPELLEKCNLITEHASNLIGKKIYITIVGEPSAYTNFVNNKMVNAEDADILVRMIFMNQTHKAYAASQTICCGAASAINGSIVAQMVRGKKNSEGMIRLGHPAGVSEVMVLAEEHNGEITFNRIEVSRTARRLLEGYGFIKL